MNYSVIKCDGREINFFKLLYHFDKLSYLNKVRICLEPKTKFPVNAIQSIQKINENSIEIKVTFFGLYGVSSVLPPFMNELALSNNVCGETLRAFLDIFQKRLHILKYQIWKNGYAPFFIGHSKTQYAKLLRSISGNKLPSTYVSPSYNVAGILGKRSISMVNVAKIVKVLTGFHTKVKENILQWTLFRRDMDKPRLGDNILLGNRYLENRRFFIIRVDCQTTENLHALYHHKWLFQQIHSTIKPSLNLSMHYQLILEATQGFLPMRLGTSSLPLGFGGVLGRSILNTSVLVKLWINPEK